MKINKLPSVCLVLGIVLLSLFFWYLFVSLPQYRFILQESSDQAINIFKSDPSIKWISYYSIWLQGNNTFCPFDIKYMEWECSKKVLQHRNLMNQIPKDTVFYRCNNNFFIRKINDILYQVNINYPFWDIIHSWIKLTWSPYKSNGWFSYIHGPHIKDSDPCYPWNNLEDYWKRYGKASPESIQAVIDGWKNS